MRMASISTGFCRWHDISITERNACSYVIINSYKDIGLAVIKGKIEYMQVGWHCYDDKCITEVVILLTKWTPLNFQVLYRHTTVLFIRK